VPLPNLGGHTDARSAECLLASTRSLSAKEGVVPRYLVERSFPDWFRLASDGEGAQRYRDVIERNADDGVTWLLSYVSDDRTRTFCVYDGPSPEAIRKTAARNRLPVDRITQVRVLDPYFYPDQQRSQ
jgi:hypothetical protein